MTLTADTKLGPYEIFSPIGVGGMGEVYKVRDTRLDRTVAGQFGYPLGHLLPEGEGPRRSKSLSRVWVMRRARF